MLQESAVKSQTPKIQLNEADHNDVRQIISQVYDLWSSGLSKEHYRQLFWSSYLPSCSKKHNHRFVYKTGGRVATSGKLSQFSFLKRGKYYQILGLSAVFTAPDWRGKGLASGLVEWVIDKAKREKFDGILLFSAIDKSFYNFLGFESLGSLDFEIDPRIYDCKGNFCGEQPFSIEIKTAEALCKNNRQLLKDGHGARFHSGSFSPWFSENDLIAMVRCYNRYIASQPYGIVRNYQYFSFKLARFIYLASYSITNKGNWFLTILRNKANEIIAYAITECGGKQMRIIELIGSCRERAYLWQNLIGQAQKLSLEKVCGFEALVRDFIPNCQFDYADLSIKPFIRPEHIQCSERFWSQPMFFSLNPHLQDIFTTHPCPIIEFDFL